MSIVALWTSCFLLLFFVDVVVVCLDFVVVVVVCLFFAFCFGGVLFVVF